jgi:hypothetical protein
LAGDAGAGVTRTRDDERAPAGGRTQDPVIANLVNPRGRDQGGELLQQLQGLEDDVRRPIAPAALEAVEQPAVGKKR